MLTSECRQGRLREICTVTENLEVEQSVRKERVNADGEAASTYILTSPSEGIVRTDLIHRQVCRGYARKDA